MPAAIPFVAAAFSIAEGVAIGGMLGGLMIAGGGLTAVGALTGDKKLMKIGGLLGLAGGVGSLISNAGAAATTAGAQAAGAEAGVTTTANVGGNVVQGAGADAISGAAEQAMNTSSQAGNALADVGSTAGSTPAGLAGGEVPAGLAGGGSPGGLIGDAVKEPWALNGPGEGGGLADAGGASAAPTSTVGQNAPSAMVQGPAPTAVGPGVASPPGGMDYLQAADQSAGLIPAGQPGAAMNTTLTPEQMAQAGFKNAGGPSDWLGKVKQYGKDFGAFTKEHPALTQAGGALIYGAMNNYGQQAAIDEQYKRQMAYQDWVRQRYSDSMRNLRVPRIVRTPSASDGIIGGARG